ncbi:MAG: HPr(Ser) kinase/phosphatase [Elusimicrobia bacterium]|nr:HPr(Ser) kinase/phosphatase [Candidatus Liberimonas magnetica]
MSALTVETFLKEKGEALKLKLHEGKAGLSRAIKVSEINRPGLTFSGYLEHFSSERIQIIGLGEYSYLRSLTSEKRTEVFKKIFTFKDIPCCILSRGLKPLPEMLSAHKKNKVPLMTTELTTSSLMAELITYLEEKMAESTTMHGVLVNVYGLGVLIVGDAGIGKSECALELIKRNHMLVADDIVQIHRHSGGILIANRDETIQYHMELRGLGIIDVDRLFGVGFILDKSRIELVVRFEEWDPQKEYDRIGLEEKHTMILGIDIPEVIFPVRSGRNLAVLIEIASLNQQLKKRGFYSAKELNARLINMMSSKA